jgi:hypothetical protein
MKSPWWFRTGRFAIALGVCAASVAWPGHLRAEAGLRCPDGVVSRGASQTEVEARCGEPTLIEQWQAPATGVADELWTYDFGPRRLLRMLRFRDGRLSVIDSDGYGYGATARGNCRPQDIQRGWSSYRLISACGEPAERKVIGALLAPRPERTVGGVSFGTTTPSLVEVYREEWRYDFGSRYLMRVLTLDDGRVTQVVTDGRGGRR